ncbi:MAG: hypothetical protein JWO36_363 [Myxococcales bacterium]|nr:hypothetical protein [Myxococcales bacterium]
MKVAIALVVGLIACGPKIAPNGVSPNDAIVYLKSNVGDAQVYVDGKFVGPLTVLRGGIAVEPGVHRVELRHDDYFSRYLELDLRRSSQQHLDVELAPVLP